MGGHLQRVGRGWNIDPFMARGDVVKHRGDHKKSDVMATLITLHARHDKGHWGGGVIGWQGGRGELCVCVGGGGVSCFIKERPT